MTEHRHKSSSLKQVNKKFKTRHATKGSLRDRNKGRVERQAISKSLVTVHSKADRKNASKVAQKLKREVQDIAHGRIGKLKDGPPKIIALIPLSNDANMDAVISLFSTLPHISYSVENPSLLREKCITMRSDKFKQHFQFLVVRNRTLIDVMDACQVADVVLFVSSADTMVDHTANKAGTLQLDTHAALCIAALQAQGLPAHIACISQTSHASPISATLKNEYRQQLSLFFAPLMPVIDATHIFVSPDMTEIEKLFRFLCTLSIKPVRWRDQHSYLLVDRIEKHTENHQMYSLYAYIRGSNLTASRNLYLPGYGDVTLEEIRKASPKWLPSLPNHNTMDVDQPIILDRRGDSVSPDLDNIEAMTDSATDSEEENLSEQEETMDEQNAMADKEEKRVTFSDDLPPNSMNQENNGNEEEREEEEEYQAYMNAKKSMGRHREESFEEAKEFPDEVDVDRNENARERFKKYRGLKDFQLSPWDSKEGLPEEYSSITELQNVLYARKYASKDALNRGIPEGTYVQLFISLKKEAKDADDDWSHFLSSKSFMVAFQPLSFEEHTTVLNCLVTRPTENSIVSPCYSSRIVKSKDVMILQSGFRRFYVRPVFSEHASRVNTSKFRMNTYLKSGDTCIATLYGFVNLVKCAPLVLFHAQDEVIAGKTGIDLLSLPINQLPVLSSNEESLISPLIATGTLMNMQPRRIILKRVRLTGMPYKINPRSVVARFMFFNAPDIHWFSPVPLSTKYGRVGHIRESLGTKGHMKCVFDGPIKQNDTICMHLYKRVFPRRYF